MAHVIEARNLSKTYRKAKALDAASFRIEPGRIVGLIGPNGAGKTTMLKAVLGLIRFEGKLDVLGHHPRRERAALMEKVSFIAGVATLPNWIRAGQVIDYVEAVHPRFDRARCEAFLKDSKLAPGQRVREMSKGMIAQLHLALVMAIDAPLLVLDEPTLDVDSLYRKPFYQRLLNDYFNVDRTILVTTQRLEEVEHILTDALFIRDGKIVLDVSLDTLGERFVEVLVDAAQLEAARALGPVYAHALPFDKHVLLFEGVPSTELAGYGEIRTPSLADVSLAVSIMQSEGVAA